MSRITEAFRGLWDSLVRTYSPWLVGGVVSWLVSLGVELDPKVETQLTLLIAGLAGALYYVLVRVAERFVPKVGWLLGSAKQPVYAKPEAVGVVQDTATVANRTL